MEEAAKWFLQLGPDVSELYSLPRIVQEAVLRSYGERTLKQGWSFDLTVDHPETGQHWDLSSGKIRSKVSGLIKHDEPYMIIYFSVCTAFA